MIVVRLAAVALAFAAPAGVSAQATGHQHDQPTAAQGDAQGQVVPTASHGPGQAGACDCCEMMRRMMQMMEMMHGPHGGQAMPMMGHAPGQPGAVPRTHPPEHQAPPPRPN
ncbi:MAG: hypothetical protein ACXWU1_04930 [Allosphingosinicella sp.]